MNPVAAPPTAATGSYAVPKRFGMAGMLAITTFMAGLFGLLRACNAHPAIYVFLGVLSLITCLVQMRYGNVPRIASFIAGAITLPVYALLVAFVLEGTNGLLTAAFTSPLLAVFGAGFGYLAGACTAGVFLLMDLADPYLPGATGPRYARQSPAKQEIITAMLVVPPPDHAANDDSQSDV